MTTSMKTLFHVGLVAVALLAPHASAWAQGDTTTVIRLRPLPSEKNCLTPADTTDVSLPRRPCPPPAALTTGDVGKGPKIPVSTGPYNPIPREANFTVGGPGPTGCILRPGHPTDCGGTAGR